MFQFYFIAFCHESFRLVGKEDIFRKYLYLEDCVWTQICVIGRWMGIGHVADNKFIADFFCETKFDKFVSILISVVYVVIFSVVKFSFG